MALYDINTKSVKTLKFTSKGKLIEDDLKGDSEASTEHASKSNKAEKKEDDESSQDDELKNEQMRKLDYGYREYSYVNTKDDCFNMLQEKVKEDESIKNTNCNMSILHSRFAEVRRYYQNNQDGGLGIPDEHAHPNIDKHNKIAVFHNGQIANQDDLIKEAQDQNILLGEGQTYANITDSQLITALISAEMDKDISLRQSIKNVVEQKLLGTYRLAIIEISNPESIFFVKNSGDFAIGQNKTNDEIIVTSDLSIFNQDKMRQKYQITQIPNN